MCKENDYDLDELEAMFDELFVDLDAVAPATEDAPSNIITLTDENGENADFKFLDLIEYRNEKYIVLFPVEEADEGGEVVILKVEEIGPEDETYCGVEDEDTLMAVYNIFREKSKDKFNFVD